jgi:hypothetical protein
MSKTIANWKNPAGLLRLLGIFLLGILIWRLDLATIINLLKSSIWQLILLAVFLNIPMIFIKATRWWYLMRTQSIVYPLSQSFLGYLSSIFVGLLTPGRLGELTKALYITSNNRITMGQALSSVLADRLFDLSALLIVGGVALASIINFSVWQGWVGVITVAGGLTFTLLLLLTEQGFSLLKTFVAPLGKSMAHLFMPGGWIFDTRAGLKQFSILTISIAGMLTALAYLIFFGQCYLLALSLKLPLSFMSTSSATALGSLVSLLPISISGIGTRDAAIVAYLGTYGIPPEKAFAFSLLIFLTFYIGGGIMGAIAWWIKPIPLKLKIFRFGSN